MQKDDSIVNSSSANKLGSKCGDVMTDNVIRLPKEVTTLKQITRSELEELTTQVMEEVFAGSWYNTMQSYVEYCRERDLRPNRKAHFDWAHVCLGTTVLRTA